MTLWHPSSPQGESSAQGLFIIGKPLSPKFGAPQGLADVDDPLADWFDTSWNQRIPLTVKPSQVPSTQTDFPTLINLILPSLIGFSINELRFAGVDGVQLEYEIQKFNDSTGKLIAWVKKPIIDNGNIFYIYYDNITAVDEANPGLVWENNFAKWHFTDNGNDSTVNNFTATGALAFTDAKIDRGIDFDMDRIITVPTFLDLNPSNSDELTVSFWFKGTAPMSVIRYQPPTGDFFVAHWSLSGKDDTIMSWDGASGNGLPTEIVKDGITWNYTVITWKRNVANGFKIYLNGNLVNQRNSSNNTIPDLNTPLRFGSHAGSGGSEFTRGILGDSTISESVDSADTIKTQYNNQNDQNAFWLVSPRQKLVNNLLLDLFPNARAAYSLRQLRTEYLGPAIRVRRTSDSTESDIGFLANGNLDVASLKLFVGVSDGLVTILYDQSENGIDLDAQTNSSAFPKIIDAGTLQISGLFSAMNFDGSNDDLFSTINLASPASHLFVFGVWKKLDLGNTPTNFNLNSPNLGTRVSVHAPFNSGAIFWDTGNTGVERLVTSTDFNDLDQHEYTFTKTVGTDRQIIKRDRIQLAQKTQATSSTVLGNVTIGSFGDGSFHADMNFQELIFYDTDRFADIEEIENNIIDYWLARIWADDSGNQFVTDTNKNLVFVP